MNPLSREHGWDRGTPIDRYYIEFYLKAFRRFIKGAVAEIGENKYTKKFGERENVRHSDILSAYKGTPQTIVCDLADKTTFPENIIGLYDCFILTQVLNTIFDVKSAIQNVWSLLSSDGVAMVTVPFLNHISKWDESQWGEYWRFTPRSLTRLFEESGFKTLNISTFGNLEIVKMFLEGVVLEDKIICKQDLSEITIIPGQVEIPKVAGEKIDYGKKLLKYLNEHDGQYPLVVAGVFQKC